MIIERTYLLLHLATNNELRLPRLLLYGYLATREDFPSRPEYLLIQALDLLETIDAVQVLDLARDPARARDPGLARDLAVARLLQSDRRCPEVTEAGIGLLEAWTARRARSRNVTPTFRTFVATAWLTARMPSRRMIRSRLWGA